jgi:hypothetical protein
MGMGVGDLPGPASMTGEVFRPPTGPAATPTGPGPGLIPTPKGLLEPLASSLSYFNAFWTFAALGLGLVLLALFVIIVLLMRLCAVEKGKHVGTE